MHGYCVSRIIAYHDFLLTYLFHLSNMFDYRVLFISELAILSITSQFLP